MERTILEHLQGRTRVRTCTTQMVGKNRTLNGCMRGTTNFVQRLRGNMMLTFVAESPKQRGPRTTKVSVG